MHMKTKYTLFRRDGIYYSQDSASGKQKSLCTRGEAEAVSLLNGLAATGAKPAIVEAESCDG
jgi:hypothetical protein